MLLQDTLKYFGYSEDPLCLLSCGSFSSWIHVWIIPHPYWGFVHPQLFRCFAKFFEMPFDLPKSSVAYCSWSSLPACIMVTSICQAIFIKILCDRHSDPVDSTCVWVHTIISYSLKIILPARMSFWTWAGCRPIKLPPFVPLSLFNLLIFWSEHLLLIPQFGNHNSLYLISRIIKIFL